MTRPICGAPCHYGGMSSARKYARVDLGWMGHCNRPVKAEGDRCWQHREAAACDICHGKGGWTGHHGVWEACPECGAA